MNELDAEQYWGRGALQFTGRANYRPGVAQDRPDTARAREIAEHNEAVERRKAEKKARKLAR